MTQSDQWIAEMFEALLKELSALDWLQRESPSIFLVYAHDTTDMTMDKPADDKIAQQLIQWLRGLGADIYSDRTPQGNNLFIEQTPFDPASVHDILASQLCLLPRGMMEALDGSQRVKHIILCGSARRGHYSASAYYQQEYAVDLRAACQSSHPVDRIRAYFHSQVSNSRKGFHHVLTELAFLQLRAEHAPDNPGIIPVLLNGTAVESFPRFIVDSTTIRIEDMRWRVAGDWKGQTSYANQGLHQGFFKLLKRLWPNQERPIQILGEAVYKQMIQTLHKPSPPKSAEEFMAALPPLVLKAREQLIQEAGSTLRIRDTQQIQTRIMESLHTLEQKLGGSAIDLDALRQALYEVTRQRLEIQRVSNQPLSMEHCYINLAVVEHQPMLTERQSDFRRPPSFEAIPTTNLQNFIALEDLFQPRKLKHGKTGVPQRILIHGRAGIGKTTLSKKTMYEYLENGRWQEQFDWVLWIPLRKLKGKCEAYQLEKLLYDDYFRGKLQGKVLAQALVQQIQKAPTRALLILDGWDEIAPESQTSCCQALLNHPRVIITTRPYSVDLSRMKPDLELETIGFSAANVNAYLNHPDIVPSTEAVEIKHFIQHHPFVQDLVNIPIQLDALCYSWDLIKHEQTNHHTMTGLYRAMVHKLWCKDILRLDKQKKGESF